MMYYVLIKEAHITFATLSILLFVARFLCSVNRAAIMKRRWIRVLPHVIDTLLLTCGITLMGMLAAWPQRTPWLAAKLIALCFYIGFGILAFRWRGAPGAWPRWLFALLAVATFGYIVTVAVTKNPFPLA